MQPIQTSPVNLYNNNNNSNNKLFPFPPQQPPQQPQQKSMDPFGSLLWKMWNFTKFFAFFQERCTITAHHIYFCFSLYCFSHHFCYFMFFILLHPQLWKRWVYFFELSIFYCISIGCLRSKFLTFDAKKDCDILGTYLVHCSLKPSHFWDLKG